jgi:hypothetical protein
MKDRCKLNWVAEDQQKTDGQTGHSVRIHYHVNLAAGRQCTKVTRAAGHSAQEQLAGIG